MRSKILLLLACALLGACATEDLAVTGIPRTRAIAIATAACKEYPARFSVVDRAKWIRNGAYWEVEITDARGDYGRYYRINRDGKIIGGGTIPAEMPEKPAYRGPRVYEEAPVYYYDNPHPYYWGPGHPYRPYGRRGWWY